MSDYLENRKQLRSLFPAEDLFSWTDALDEDIQVRLEKNLESSMNKKKSLKEAQVERREAREVSQIDELFGSREEIKEEISIPSE